MSCGFLFGVPAMVTPGLLPEVDAFGWNVFGVTVGGEPDCPAVVMNALLMDDVVVEVADEDAVVEVGFAAVGPGTVRVMDFAPIGGPVTAREGFPQALRAGRCPRRRHGWRSLCVGGG